MIYAVNHKTTYHYGQPVTNSRHVLHLTPRSSTHQVCRRSNLTVTPAPAVFTQDEDDYGNPVTHVAVQDQHTELVVSANSVVEVQAPPYIEPGLTVSWTDIKDMLERGHVPGAREAAQFTFHTDFTQHAADLAGYTLQSFGPGRPVLEAALDLTARIHADFVFDHTATTISTPVDEVFRIKRGVCQDFAHFQIACLRALGLPARYVSGYLRTYPPEGQEKLAGADASHAWLSLWCPEHGWIDLDPTNNVIPSTEHITLAWGRDYGDVSPIEGVICGGGQHTLSVSVDVKPASQG